MTALALVAPGDTITSAQQNIVRTDFTVLDARTGGDPGAAGKLPVSDGAASVAWTVGSPAIVGLLGYTPANKAGDTFGGSIVAVGDVSASGGNLNGVELHISGGAFVGGSMVAAGGINGGNYGGGSTSAGVPSFLGINVGASGIGVSGTVLVGGSIVATGGINGGNFNGGSTTVGVPSFLGINVGTSGIATTGSLNPASYIGGSTSAGVPSFLGANIGGTGLAISGQINSSVSTGTPPFIIASSTQVANLNAFMLQGIQPTATPTGSRIPISDSSGLLDSWVSASAGAVPSGMGCLWSNTIASIPAGWSRWTAMNGRIPVSAGTTFSTTFVEGTSYGSSWSHTHTGAGHTHGASALGVTGNTGTNSASGQSAGTGTSRADSPHTHDQGTLDVTGSTDSTAAGISTDAWVIPMFAVVAVTKN